MNEIHILDNNTIDQIAAGEVVERPSSIVKELVENAIDAGASSVTVSILDSGKTLIQVIDDGCGMSPDDAVLCFERHATSKIASAEDLESVRTYGFRGEALASIAAIAQVTLKTRRISDEIGTAVEVSDSVINSKGPVSCPVGSNFSIRNIFFNVPARRKFLKSDAVEMRNIVQEFLRIALTRPEINLKLVSNGKDLYNLHRTDKLKQRVHDVIGSNAAESLVEISVDTSVVKLRGYIGNPQDAVKRQANQFFFVNKRYFRSPYFNKAVCQPYEKLIPQENSPAYFLYLEVDPTSVDVNIHPAKTEVKFEEESVIYEIISACVREGLGKNAFTPSIEFDTSEMPDIPAFNPSSIPSGSAPRDFRNPSTGYEALFNPFERNGSERLLSEEAGNSLFVDKLEAVPVADLIVIQKKYIITPVKSGVMLINILRARTRVYYERFLEKVSENQPVTQQTLFPVNIRMDDVDRRILLEQPDLLEMMGFDIRDFGGGSVVVYGMPEGYSLDEESVRQSIADLVSALRDDEAIGDYRQILAAKMAESAARAGINQFKNSEAQMLVDQLFACREPSLTPDGRKCMTIVKTEELDKLI